MVAAIMLRDHLQRVQRLLSCRDALRGDLFAMSRTQNQPTQLPVSVMVRQAKTPVNRKSEDNSAEGVTGFRLSDAPKVSATLPSHHDRVLADLADENLSCAESIERTSVAVAEGAGRFRPKLTRLNTNLSRASRGGASEIEVGFSALTSPGTVPQASFVFEAKRQAPTSDGSRSDCNDGVLARYNPSACSNDGFRVDDDDSDAGIGVGADHSTMPPQFNNGMRAAPSPVLTGTSVSKFDWDAYKTSVRGTVEMQRVGTGVYRVYVVYACGCVSGGACVCLCVCLCLYLCFCGCARTHALAHAHHALLHAHTTRSRGAHVVAVCAVCCLCLQQRRQPQGARCCREDCDPCLAEAVLIGAFEALATRVPCGCASESRLLRCSCLTTSCSHPCAVVPPQKAVVLSTIAKVCALLDKAPVDDMPLSTRGSCAVLCWKRKGLCRPRNKQEQLLCFGSQGVRFTRLFIQVLVLTTALYVTTANRCTAALCSLGVGAGVRCVCCSNPGTWQAALVCCCHARVLATGRRIISLPASAPRGWR